MLSIVIVLVLLGFATSDIEFLTPTSGQEFATNQSIPIKWRKVSGASNYSINWNSCNGSGQTFKEPSKCKPRVSIGPLQEGYWNVIVKARNQSGDIIDSGTISVRVCESVPCPNDCIAGQVLRYYKAIGYKFKGAPNFTFPGVNEDECVDACTNNTINGSTPAPCKSASFNNETKECALYEIYTYPQGFENTGFQTTMTKNAMTVHYEKVCVNAALGDSCTGPYFVEPDMSLSAPVNVSIRFCDMNDCLRHCINSQVLYNFVCQSATIIFDPPKCYLKTESRSTRPYGVSAGGGVAYIEPGCM